MTTPREEIAKYLTGAELSRYFIDKMGIISVKSYGAEGDGVTDDHEALQDAVDAAVDAGNSMVWCPHGAYSNSAVLTDSSKVSFIGDNASITGTTYTVRDWALMLTENSSTIVGQTTTLQNHSTRIQALESTAASFSTSITALYSQTTSLRTDLNTHTTDATRHLSTTMSTGGALTVGALPYFSTTSNAWLNMAMGTARQNVQVNATSTGLTFADSIQSIISSSGDIVVGSAANTPTVLARGTALQYLRVNSGGTALEYGALPNTIASGTYTGDGTSVRTVSLGFTPKFFSIQGNSKQWNWTGDLTGASYAITGTNTCQLDGTCRGTAGGMLVDSTGINSNANGVTYYYMAIA